MTYDKIILGPIQLSLYWDQDMKRREFLLPLRSCIPPKVWKFQTTKMSAYNPGAFCSFLFCSVRNSCFMHKGSPHPKTAVVIPQPSYTPPPHTHTPHPTMVWTEAGVSRFLTLTTTLESPLLNSCTITFIPREQMVIIKHLWGSLHFPLPH